MSGTTISHHCIARFHNIICYSCRNHRSNHTFRLNIEIHSSAMVAVPFSKCPSLKMAHYTNQHKENERVISSTLLQNTFTLGDI